MSIALALAVSEMARRQEAMSRELRAQQQQIEDLTRIILNMTREQPRKANGEAAVHPGRRPTGGH